MGTTGSRYRGDSWDTAHGYSYSNLELQRHEYAWWGFFVLYLIVLVGSVILNSLFLYTIKANPNLHRCVHYMLACLAVRDLIVTLAVVPFVMQSQAWNALVWDAGAGMCKVFSFMDVATSAAHSFLLVILTAFLYFWYRKNEAYVTEEGQTVVRKNRMHKWAIPLIWVLGIGLAIPAGSVADTFLISRVPGQNYVGRTCALWDGVGTGDAGFATTMLRVIVGFFVPLALIVFPFVALAMQLGGTREPRLDPPHSRTAATALALCVIFVCTRAPSEVFSLMQLSHQAGTGYHGTNLIARDRSAQIVISAIVYLAPLIDPMLYFLLNPDYRHGLVYAWRQMYCNKDPAEREREAAERRAKAQQRQQHRRPYIVAGRNRAPANQRQGQDRLLAGQQPIIIGGAQPQQFYQPYAGQPGLQPQLQQQLQQQQPLLTVQQQQQLAAMQMQQLQPDQQFLDTSFDRLSPQLPPVFEYDGLKYIDTARVEPKIGYSPEKTPPKTPDTPRYQHKPFLVPGVDVPMHPGTLRPTDHSLPPGASIEMTEMRSQSFKVESLEGSPGVNLRSRRIKEDMDESVEVLDDSPGTKHRRKHTQESQETQSSGYQGSSRPLSPVERPSSRGSAVQIVISGRTRSRTDLCPDVPRSKFEHSV